MYVDHSHFWNEETDAWRWWVTWARSGAGNFQSQSQTPEMEAFCVSTSSLPRAKGYKKCFHSGVPNPAYYQDKLVHLKQNQKKEGKEGKKKGRKRKEGRKRNNTKSPCRFLDSLWKIEGLCWILEIYIWVPMPTPTTSLSQVILMKTQVGSHDFIYSILSKAAA